MGFAHPDHLLAALTASQVAEWLAFANIEPFGELRADFRAGQIAATVANFAGKTLGEHAEHAVAADFMPALAEGRKPPEPILLPPEEQAKLIKARIFGIKD